MANNFKEDPKTAPQSDRWYDLVLGPSFKDYSSNKYCTLRYEFKPASIDKSRPGTLHKNKDNRVSVEFQNNQVGKSKVTFEGSSEDYKENDAVLFFSGETFRLERLHRAVKQLRHLRMPGESAAAALSTLSVEPRLSPVGRGVKPLHVDRCSVPAVPVEVERIEIGKPENPGGKANGKDIVEEPPKPAKLSATAPRQYYNEAGDEHSGIDMNVLRQQHHDTDEEIADVDDSGDEGEKGPNAAEALRSQVRAQKQQNQQTSTSSGSGTGTGTASSGSGGRRSSSSSSSSSESDASNDDSINSV